MTKLRLFTAAALTVGVLAVAPTSAFALDSQQVVQGTVLPNLSLTIGTPTVVLGSMTPDGPAATGTGTFTVISNDCYNVAIRDADAANNTHDGFLSPAVGASPFGARLQWKVDAGTLADLTQTSASVVSNVPNTPLTGTQYTVTYSQSMTGQNVPSGLYSTTATISTTACA